MDDLPWLVNIREERKLGGYHFAYYNIQQSISQQTVLSHNSVNSHKSPKIDSLGFLIFYIENTTIKQVNLVHLTTIPTLKVSELS